MLNIQVEELKKLINYTISMLVAFCFFTHSLSAQQLHFPAKNFTDSATLANQIPALAIQVLEQFKTSKADDYLDQLFRYQLVAKQYKAALQTMDSNKAEVAKEKWEGAPALGIQFYTYMLTMINLPNSNQSFEQLYESTLNKEYSKLPESAKSFVGSFFSADVESLKKTFDNNLKKYRSAGDSISLNDAKQLCRNFNSYTIYSRVKAIGLKLLTAIDNEKYFIKDSVLISVKGGATLSAVLVKLKNNPAKLPAVLMYNIYAGEGDLSTAKTAADKGYLGIVVNTRGKKLSKDNIEPFEHDAADAYDMLSWISSHEWCNGSIGMYGGSYLGFSQWSAVKKMHPALKTIVPQVAVGIGIDYPMHNNVFMSYMLQWIHYVQNSKLTDQADFGNAQKWERLFKRWYVNGTAFNTLDSLDNAKNVLFQRWLAHPSYDQYWQSMVPYQQEFAQINIPVLTTTGYYDDDQRGAMYYFDQHHQYNKKAQHYLLIGPYNHGGAQSAAIPKLGGYTIDSVANISINEIVFKWFDHFLKDSVMPAMLKDKINYQVMGTNEWKHSPTLKAMNNDTLHFYLDNTIVNNQFKLASNKPTATQFIKQEIDLADRSDSNKVKITDIGSVVEDSILRGGDELVFVTAPLKESLTINGSFEGNIQAIINKKDMDLLIGLYEQLPNGK
ncbi:MAG: CocE/NonD family hydrolase, partial [Sediminibacterium sp.]|nr:CocE/NonD family hydrolase [Sediminibacterium sp.]